MCAGGNSVRIRQDYGLAETPGFQQVPGIAGFVFIRERAHLYTVETPRAGAHFTQSRRSLRCFPALASRASAGSRLLKAPSCTNNAVPMLPAQRQVLRLPAPVPDLPGLKRLPAEHGAIRTNRDSGHLVRAVPRR